MPIARSFLTYAILSSVFLAKRLIDFVMIRSILPRLQSRIMRMKSGLFSACDPHSPDSAESGGYSTGIGNSSNVVVDGNTYDEILQRIRMIDAETAESMYNIAVQIEEMCQSIYIVPSTLPKYLAIVDKVKASLGEFQSLTDEARSFANGFVEEVTHIDGQ